MRGHPVREAVEDAAFTDQISEHDHADKRNRVRCDETSDDGCDDWEKDLRRLRNRAWFVLHTDETLFFRRYEFDCKRLNDWHECHIAVGCDSDRSDIV